VLGGQFAEREGVQLIQRAFNPSLPSTVNAQRIQRLLEQMENAIKAKEAASDYYEQNGTLVGFQGRLPSMDDFYSAVDSVGPGAQAQPQQAAPQAPQAPQGPDQSDLQAAQEVLQNPGAYSPEIVQQARQMMGGR